MTGSEDGSIGARGERPGGVLTPEILPGPRAGARSTWVEIPAAGEQPAAWCYTDHRTYHPGSSVDLFVSTTVQTLTLRISRDDEQRAPIATIGPLAGLFLPAPDHAYEVGCDWQAIATWQVPDDARPGPYLVEVVHEVDQTVIGHHLFFIRNAGGDRTSPGSLVLVAATSTWAAYNDWGGANHYFGLKAGTPRGRSPILSTRRPWARGQIWLPEGAPRIVNAHRSAKPEPARYECVEWAYLNGFSKYYASAGWATYERPFFLWAEKNGYLLDIITQDELHSDPSALEGYPCAVFVGHDEYWTREMRENVETYVRRGGRAARFAGNFLWQIRLEERNSRQVAYKYDARTHDPLAGTPNECLMTSAWEDPLVNYPGARTFGVNSLRGIYAAFGGMARRAPRGFTVFRPEHWAFETTGLGYADMFGDEASIFGFEMDGLDYTFKNGLPEPTGTDGAPEGLEIIAMGWATLAETGRPEDAYSLMLGDADARFREALLGDGSNESLAIHSRGSGMVVSFQMGAGEVFTAATCEWVNGLIQKDFYTETITRNVLDRFSNRIR